jgi:adenylate kinase family enzyme
MSHLCIAKLCLSRASSLPHRVAVIGRAGAGKTVVARRIAEALDLPVVHLDRLYWGPEWEPVAAELFDTRQAAAVSGEAWVIDGGYMSSQGWRDRIQRADVIVLVKAPLLVCLWRILRRSLIKSPGRRPDLPDGCEEQLSVFFLWWTLGWAIRNRGLQARIHQANADAALIVVTSSEDGASLVGRLAKDRVEWATCVGPRRPPLVEQGSRLPDPGS